MVTVESADDPPMSERSRRRDRGCGRLGLEADLQSACPSAGQPIETVGQQACGPALGADSRPRHASARAVRPPWWGRTRTARSRLRRLSDPRPPDRASGRRASTGAAAPRPAHRCERSSDAGDPVGPADRPRRTLHRHRWRDGRRSIHAVPDNSSVITNPLRMARSTSDASSPRTSIESPRPDALAVLHVAAHTSSSATVEGTAKTSACQVSPQAVKPAAATGPTSSNQTGSASYRWPEDGATTTGRRRPPTCRSAVQSSEPAAGPRWWR